MPVVVKIKPSHANPEAEDELEGRGVDLSVNQLLLGLCFSVPGNPWCQMIQGRLKPGEGGKGAAKVPG